MKEYKVLSQSDSFWKDRFSPQLLEESLNDLAKKGWRVVTCAASEFTGLGGLGTKRQELFVLLERDAWVPPEMPKPEPKERLPYDAARIPADRFYKDAGNVSSGLQQAGLVTKAQMNEAREEFARRGGHLCDHLLALGFIDEAQLRTFLGKAP